MAALTALLGAVAGVLAAISVRELFAVTPALARGVEASLEPLRRAGSEGHAPTASERRRLALLGSAGLLVGGALLLGPGPAPLVAAAGPAAGALSIARRRRSYRRSVERSLPSAALSCADALAAGRPLRSALLASPVAVAGPGAVELSRLASDLELGMPTRTAVQALQSRVPGRAAESFCSSLLASEGAGEHMASLLRRHAEASADRLRLVADARAATAQARFTGVLVAAMPAGALLVAELASPGFVGGMLADPVAAACLALAAVLQTAGFAAINRIARVGR